MQKYNRNIGNLIYSITKLKKYIFHVIVFEKIYG